MLMATCYVRVGNTVYTRGEVLPEITEEQKAWLLRAGAAVDMSLPEKKIEEEVEETVELVADDTDEDEIPEIDVMAGIVEKPKRKRGRSSASKA